VPRTGVDERGASFIDQQIGRVEARPVEAGVDGIDAMTQRLKEIGGGRAHR
jgi:hypothetical protein